jgi:hypothetical protein
LAHPDRDDELGALTRRVAVALARAALGQDRRVLVHADPGTILAVALAASELRDAVTVEGGEPRPPSLVLLPLPPDDSVENGIFDPLEEEEERESLLDLLAATGILDLSPISQVGRFASSASLFANFFEAQRPQTVVALGPQQRLDMALTGAEIFQSEHRDVRLFLSDRIARNEPWRRERWRSLESLVPAREADVYPTLLGEAVHDEELGNLVRLVDLETLLFLAVERIASGEVEGGPEGSSRLAKA